MIYLKTEGNRVIFSHYMPFDRYHGLGKTREELEQEGTLVESVPEPEQTKEKSAILHCNPQTKELWYEYEDIPKTNEELLQEELLQLKQRQEATDAAILQLLIEGRM